MTDRGVSTPYDWERYEQDFQDNEDYRAQEAALHLIFAGLPEPESILEVGPGLGRITRMALKQWPMARYSAADIAQAPLAEAERLSGGLENSFHGPIELIGSLPIQAYQLVLAIEVLLHIPPEAVGQAAKNLLGAVEPGGHLITCDWTRPVQGPVRVQNYLHDYMQLFHWAGASVIESQRTGYQTIFTVQR